MTTQLERTPVAVVSRPSGHEAQQRRLRRIRRGEEDLARTAQAVSTAPSLSAATAHSPWLRYLEGSLREQ